MLLTWEPAFFKTLSLSCFDFLSHFIRRSVGYTLCLKILFRLLFSFVFLISFFSVFSSGAACTGFNYGLGTAFFTSYYFLSSSFLSLLSFVFLFCMNEVNLKLKWNNLAVIKFARIWLVTCNQTEGQKSEIEGNLEILHFFFLCMNYMNFEFLCVQRAHIT